MGTGRTRIFQHGSHTESSFSTFNFEFSFMRTKHCIGQPTLIIIIRLGISASCAIGKGTVPCLDHVNENVLRRRFHDVTVRLFEHLRLSRQILTDES
jgi:hypothetical protein